MAEKKVTVRTDEVVTPETHIVKKDFWSQYSKPIIYAGSAIILLAGAWFGYKKFVKEPKEVKAAEAIFPAEFLVDKMAVSGFSKDSINIALNGGATADAKVTGLLKIMSSYSGTSSANRATYLAGACYLQNREFDKAIKYLKDFDANGAYQTDIKRHIMMGHAYSEMNRSDDALSEYKKAAAVNEKDETFTTDALIIAAAYAEKMGKTKDAIELYQKVKNKYPAQQVVMSGDVDKNLAKLGIIE